MLGRLAALGSRRCGRSGSGISGSLLSVRRRQSGGAAEQDLSMFPEYQTAKTDVANGHFKRALPGLLRVQNVISSAMGSAAPTTVHVALRTAQVLQYMGDFEGATRQLESLTSASSSSASAAAPAALRNEDLTQALHASALLHLFSGSASRALQQASQALALCEGDASVPTGLFSPSHSLLGLCHYHLGSFDDAETHLQLAARWAETPLARLAALNNLGGLVWMCGAALGEGGQDAEGAGRTVRADPRLQRIKTKSLWQKDEGDEGSAKPDSDVSAKAPTAAAAGGAAGAGAAAGSSSSVEGWSERSAKEALSYWQEALLEASRPDGGGDGAATSASAAGCAPPSPSSSPLGPGMEPKIVPSATSASASASSPSSPASASSSTAGLSADEVLAARLAADSQLATAYATVLCNCADAHAALGRPAEASAALSSALRALEPHKAALACHPVLGRVLCAVAYSNMAASMAVTAEGLFRSALDKLQGPHALSDPRYQFERLAALGGYSILLSKWERRERDGAAMLAEATRIFEALPRFSYQPEGGGAGAGEGVGAESLYDAKLLPLSACFLYPGAP